MYSWSNVFLSPEIDMVYGNGQTSNARAVQKTHYSGETEKKHIVA